MMIKAIRGFTGVLILIFVFWFGFQFGEIRASLGNGRMYGSGMMQNRGSDYSTTPYAVPDTTAAYMNNTAPNVPKPNGAPGTQYGE
jgi:hypothetical protein